jgi:SAM-dependent methyltransferase
VIWHDLECGGYAADLPLWRELADRHGDPVLDVGAGTGRVALDLARRGHRVTALDHDPALVAELGRRAAQLPVRAVLADARGFALGERFGLIIAPMQTIQLLGGRRGRTSFLAAAAGHLRPGGRLAIAITDAVDCFEEADGALPTPDLRELDGVLYSSQPTAVRRTREGFLLERRRQRVDAAGALSASADRVRLDRLTAAELEREARAVGLRPRSPGGVAPTTDHVGSLVVMLDG